MESLILTLLTIVCVVLSVAFVGALRSIAELRMRLLGYGERPGQGTMRIDAGRPIPRALAENLPEGTGAGIVAFLSETCSTCWELAGELHLFEGGHVSAVLPGSVSSSMRERLGPDIQLMEPEVGLEISEDMQINMTPVVVLHENGLVIGSAVGQGAESIADLTNLWKITVT
jgi:hypothetical protein